MSALKNSFNDLNLVKNEIQKVLKQFDKVSLSMFEMGQADGLRWALDILKVIKNLQELQSAQGGVEIYEEARISKNNNLSR